MKKTFFMRAGLFFLILQAPSNVAVSAEHGWESTVAISCEDKRSAFPSPMFTRLNRDMHGSVSGFEIHLSYDSGACSSLLYATGSAESHINASDHDDDLTFDLR